MTSSIEIAHARLDDKGRLLSADQPLTALNARAGGAIGQPLAVSPIATLARLAQRLGILLSRGVVVAEDGRDLDLWVRAAPDRDGVRLSVCGWHARDAWQPEAIEPVRTADFVRAETDWHWRADAALLLVSISSEAVERHGLDLRRLLGKPLTGLFTLIEDEEGRLPILEASAGRRSFANQAARVRADGVAVTISAAVRTDAGGAFAGFVGGAHLRDEPAGAASGLTDAFGRGLAQVLRTPLDRIIANADSISARLEGPLRQDYADYAVDIASAGRHLLGLVDDLADADLIERPDFALWPEPIDLADVARRAAGLLSMRATGGGVAIERPAPGLAIPATGDFRRSLQVLVNLIGNAVRYSPRGGTVWVRLEQDGEHAVAIVADQGKGIALADQARIFDKFERVDPGEPGGNGLGLYIARRLARAMGGDLRVDSAPGEGARFLFALPRG